MGQKYQEYINTLGETIIYYQLVEHDLRYIYCALEEGDFNTNLSKSYISIKGLGQIINELEKLDKEKGINFFSDESYLLLKKLARKRNYYCHSCSIDFAYQEDFENSQEFLKALTEMQITHNELISIQKQTENFRLLAIKQYKLT